MEHYSLATLLVGISIGVTALAIVLPTLHRMARGRPDKAAAPELPQWPHGTRPTRCAGCGETELVRLGEVTVSPRLADSGSPLEPRALARPIDCEMLVCTSCGRAEWYAASPRVLEPVTRAARRSLPPYR